MATIVEQRATAPQIASRMRHVALAACVLVTLDTSLLQSMDSLVARNVTQTSTVDPFRHAVSILLVTVSSDTDLKTRALYIAASCAAAILIVAVVLLVLDLSVNAQALLWPPLTEPAVLLAATRLQIATHSRFVTVEVHASAIPDTTRRHKERVSLFAKLESAPLIRSAATDRNVIVLLVLFQRLVANARQPVLRLPLALNSARV
jgi:hypothetical protein